jgi:uncharacterized membrane protein YdjX (TVP38/TMEM64 family)
MYVRLRRNIGRQALQPRRMTIRIVVLAVLTCALAGFSYLNLKLLVGLGFGLILGWPLAWVGLKTTKFETTAEGRFYTPNSTIGIALTVLFVGRIVYRVMVLVPAARNQALQQPGAALSPLSFFAFGLLAGYYIAYYSGVLMRNRAMSANGLSAGAPKASG